MKYFHFELINSLTINMKTPFRIEIKMYVHINSKIQLLLKLQIICHLFCVKKAYILH